MKPPFLLFDIGGTKTRIAVSHDGSVFTDPKIIPTPENFYEGVDRIAETAKQLSSTYGALAGGIAGPLSSDKAMIVNAPNLADWNGKPLKAELEKRLKCDVFLENDTALVGLGEAVAGAGREFSIVAYLTVSTGVNGVKIVNGNIAPNAYGFEIGKQIIDFDKSYDLGAEDFEDLVSGAGILRKYKVHAHEIKDEAIWEEEMKIVSVGLHNIAVFWSPQVIVVGGAISQALNLEKLKANLAKTLTIYNQQPEVRMSELKSVGGLHGALQYIKSI